MYINPISKTKLRAFAFVLRCEAMKACEDAQEVSDNAEPRKKAALKEMGATKKAIALRIEEMLS